MGDGALGAIFLDTWSGRANESAQLGAGLHEQLTRMLIRARRRWPGVAVDDDDFVRFVARRVPADVDPREHTARLSAGDLYLACGCCNGDTRAAAEFRDLAAEPVRAAARRVGLEAVDDLAQDLYRRLFLPEPERSPRIDLYGGTGDLRAWVTVVVTRMAIDDARKGERGRTHPEDLMDRILDETESSEFEHLRREYRSRFKDAFAQAVSALAARDRNVLRYHLDGLTADQIGRMHNVHRVTVARWLSRIRFDLLERTRTALRQALGTDQGDVESILRLLEGEVSLSIARLLQTRPG